MKNVLAKDVMRTPVVSVTHDTYLKDVIRILDEEEFSGLPVVDAENNVVGVISETDICKYTKQVIGQPLRDHDLLLEDETHTSHIGSPRGLDIIEFIATVAAQNLMTTTVITVFENTSLKEILRLMVNNNINRVPVLDADKKLTGIIARHDVLTMLKKYLEKQ